MTPDIAALEQLLERATPGPWQYIREHGSRVVADGHGFSAPYRLEPGSGECPTQNADNELIAMLRNQAPALIALAREAEGLRERLDDAARIAEREAAACFSHERALSQDGGRVPVSRMHKAAGHVALTIAGFIRARAALAPTNSANESTLARPGARPGGGASEAGDRVTAGTDCTSGRPAVSVDSRASAPEKCGTCDRRCYCRTDERGALCGNYAGYCQSCPTCAGTGRAEERKAGGGV